MQKHLLPLLLLISSTSLLTAQKLNVEGDARIQGRLIILQAVGDSSLFIGLGAGANDDGTNNQNTFIGANAGFSNTSGSLNMAIGQLALRNNTNGNFNIAIGHKALFSNTIGKQNIAVGVEAMQKNTTGENNTAVGSAALRFNTTGESNTALGVSTLLRNTTGEYNTAVGTFALQENTTAINNTAVGRTALVFNTTGSFNTATGSQALYSNTTGQFNTATGYQALKSNTTGESNTAVGTGALFSNSTGNRNTAVGLNALNVNTIGSLNTAIGSLALQLNTEGFNNTAIGDNALGQNTTGNSNTALGATVLHNTTTGLQNTGVGYNALFQNTTGNFNTSAGLNSLGKNTTGSNNTAVGLNALFNNTTGNFNTALGLNAHDNETDIDNAMGLGYEADPSASNTIVIGNGSITSIGGTVGFSNLSDSRFKTNIKNDVPGLEFINLLEPVTYNLDLHKFENWKDGKANQKNKTNWRGKYDVEDITFTGFLAQDVEAAAEEIGYEFSGVDKPSNEGTPYGLRYGSFVAPLVKATQEIYEDAQQKTATISQLQLENESLRIDLDELNQRLVDLETIVQEILGNQPQEEAPVILNQSPSLEQNQPNPTNGITQIRYFLPSGKKGELVITAIDGKELQRISLSATGHAQIEVQTRNLPAGTYNYSLVVEGQFVDTKRMTLQR